MAPGWQRRMLYTVARGREGVRHTSGFTVMPEVGLPKKEEKQVSMQVSTVKPEVFLTPPVRGLPYTAHRPRLRDALDVIFCAAH